MDAATIELTGILSGCDAHGKVRVILLDESGDGAFDPSLARLRRAAPPSAGQVPYTLDPARPGDHPLASGGVLGEFWMSPPRAKYALASLKRLVVELQGKEVRVTVAPKRYNFVSTAPHNRGAQIRGTSLQYVGLEARR